MLFLFHEQGENVHKFEFSTYEIENEDLSGYHWDAQYL